MSDLSGKTVAELKEMAREREIATRTEINRARKATLLEWLETPKPEAVEVHAPEVEEENGQSQGELFPSPPEVENLNETVEPKSEPEKALLEEPELVDQMRLSALRKASKFTASVVADAYLADFLAVLRERS